MHMKVLKYLSPICILLSVYLDAMQFDEGCFIDEPILLQIAFVVDRTGTFFDGGGNSFFNQFAAVAPKLMEEIDKDYPGTQFALTVHADWDKRTNPHSGGTPHSDPEGCYTRWTDFTTDRSNFQSRIWKIKVLYNGHRENGLSALAFTAADSKIGWIRNSTSSDGRRVRRVMILVTDEDDLLNIRNPGNRQDFKGDGTDTCSTSKPLTYKILGEVFRKYEMTVVALLFVNSAQPQIEQKYAAHFKAIGSSIPYCARPFSARSKAKGILRFESSHDYKIPKGFWSSEDIKNVNESEIGSSPSGLDHLQERDTNQRENDIAELSASVKAGKYDYLIKFIKECLGETRGCLFGDPEGFNTLGF